MLNSERFQNEYAKYHKEPDVTKHEYYGRVQYTLEGRLVCHICGRDFRKLAAHTVQKHFVDEHEYKVTFGLNTTIGLVTDELREKLSENVNNHPEVILRNLIKKGKKTRYAKGAEGRTRAKVSPQLKMQLKDRLKTAKMVISMRANGKRLGETGLGNKKRWKKDG